MYVLYYIGRCFHQKGEKGACPSFVHTNNSSSPPSLDLQWLLHYTESGFRRPDPRAAVRSLFFSFSSLSASDEADDSNFYCDERSPPPQPNSRPLLLPPFFRRGKEGRGAFLAATGYTEGGRGSAPCNEQSKKGCCCSLPPSLPSERRPFLELRCTQ